LSGIDLLLTRRGQSCQKNEMPVSLTRQSSHWPPASFFDHHDTALADSCYRRQPFGSSSCWAKDALRTIIYPALGQRFPGPRYGWEFARLPKAIHSGALVYAGRNV